MAEALAQIETLDDAIDLFDSIPNEKKFAKMERMAAKACFLKMSTATDVQQLLRLFVESFEDDLEKFNGYMEMMDGYLKFVSIDDINNLEDAMMACEQIPRQMLASEMYYFEEPIETRYEIKVIAKLKQIVSEMFDGARDSKDAFLVLDDIIEIANGHYAFKGSFQATDKAVEMVLGYVICLDEVEALYATYRRCGCISVSTFNRIQSKYLEIGKDIADQKKTVDELIKMASNNPSNHNNLYEYIIERINKVGATVHLGSVDTKKLIEYDKNIPDCIFKTAIRNELVTRIDTTI